MRSAAFLEWTFRALAIVVAVHGLVFAIGSLALTRFDAPGLEWLGEIYFFVVIAPAMLLAVPLRPLLWHFHLMEAPGWFAWPKPVGFMLAYLAWILALYGASMLARRAGARR